MSGSPPQMLTMGAPHSSEAATHSSTLSFSLMVCEYSRMRPQPVQVRLQACSGSSISTRGERFVRVSFFLAMYPIILDVRLSGKRMTLSRKKPRSHRGHRVHREFKGAPHSA